MPANNFFLCVCRIVLNKWIHRESGITRVTANCYPRVSAWRQKPGSSGRQDWQALAEKCYCLWVAAQAAQHLWGPGQPLAQVSKGQLSVTEKLPCDMPTWSATLALSSNSLPSWTLTKSQTIHFLSCKDFLDLQQRSSLNSVCPAFVELRSPISFLTSLTVVLLTSLAGRALPPRSPVPGAEVCVYASLWVIR